VNYFEYRFFVKPANPVVNEVLPTILGKIGFESFTENETGLTGYLPEKKVDESVLQRTMPSSLFGSAISSTINLINDQDWNQEWETHQFQPIVIGNDCVIHSSAHSIHTSATWNITIDPKMAFGTGYHETTCMMIQALLKADVRGKTFLDMGCGTAILAILAAMKGAVPVLAIDTDDWACRNAISNTGLNHTETVQVLTGNATLLSGRQPFDFIFANIHRNILLADMPAYVSVMHTGSELFLSGFYEKDIPAMREKAESLGLKYVCSSTKNDWVALQFKQL